MTSDKTLFDRIEITERLTNSYQGNPRYKVTLTLPDGSKWVRNTAVDSQVSYTALNPEFSDTPVWVTFDARGFIIDIEVA